MVLKEDTTSVEDDLGLRRVLQVGSEDVTCTQYNCRKVMGFSCKEWNLYLWRK